MKLYFSTAAREVGAGSFLQLFATNLFPARSVLGGRWLVPAAVFNKNFANCYD
jgi:hypothetical protein